ncbi:MAG TPA: M20/M25/M40 family metallo-hydrolase [Methanoregulaceae archaeon]|nr:M20/M25/M40 family metallo-hydrolase [Methanoregulaceae archaeon]
MDVARLASDLVKINSENPPGNTEEVIRYISVFLDSLGVRSEILVNRGGRANLITEQKEGGLLLCGHVDVVPAVPDEWDFPPCSGKIANGFLFGRGSTDMKGGCAALLSAYKDLVDRGIENNAGFLFVCDEETSGTHGICSIIRKKRLLPCDVLIAEPTPALHPTIGEKGLCRLSMAFLGEPGHSSLYPVAGVSAIMEAYRTISYLNELSGHEYHAGSELDRIIGASSKILAKILEMPGAEKIFKRIMYNPGKISGGEKSNVVAEHCSLELDIRVPWGCSIPELIGDIGRHSPRAAVNIVTASDPSLTPADCPLVAATCGEIEKAYGKPSFPIVQWAASDARFLRTEGFRVVEYGPGELKLLHARNERVSVVSLEKARDIYRGIILAMENPAGIEWSDPEKSPDC